MNGPVSELFEAQRAAWPAMRDNYAALSGVRTRSLDVRGVPYRLQFNPARAVSSSARVDAAAVAERPCFLCPAQRPPEQAAIAFGDRYEILVNPFPIFPRHLTVVDRVHTDQRIAGRFGDLLALADALTEFVVFYNGPRCGASAPDHAHFQAGSRGLLPLEQDWRGRLGDAVARRGAAMLWRFDPEARRGWLIESEGDAVAIEALFDAVVQALPAASTGEEPMMNILAWRDGAARRVLVLPRARHRPGCYPEVLCSPASVDLAGVFILPRERDFERMQADDLAAVLDEVCPSAEAYRDTGRRLMALLGGHLQEAK